MARARPTPPGSCSSSRMPCSRYAARDFLQASITSRIAEQMMLTTRKTKTMPMATSRIREPNMGPPVVRGHQGRSPDTLFAATHRGDRESEKFLRRFPTEIHGTSFEYDALIRSPPRTHGGARVHRQLGHRVAGVGRHP